MMTLSRMQRTVRKFHAFPCTMKITGIMRSADACIVDARRINNIAGTNFFFRTKPVDARQIVTATNWRMPLNIQE